MSVTTTINGPFATAKYFLLFIFSVCRKRLKSYAIWRVSGISVEKEDDKSKQLLRKTEMTNDVSK